MKLSNFLVIIFIAVIAAIPRFYLIDEYPYGIWFDEAQNILVTKQILEDPSYRPVFIGEATQLPAFSFYYYSIFTYFLGPEITSLRIAIAILGILSVISLYFLTAELFGVQTAIIASLFLALMRWHLIFSRFGMTNIFATFFAPLILLFFLKAQRTKYIRYSILCGISLGLGLQTYYVMLGFPIVILFLYLHRLIYGAPSSFKNLFVTFLVCFIAYSPVAYFAANNWEEFTRRFSMAGPLSPVKLATRVISNPDNAAEILQPLKASTIKHFKMFHIEGDPNGRHNLPGTPMLDKVSGILFLIGLAWSLLFVFNWKYSLLIVWFILNISAGIFSLEFEAPQAARSIGLTPILAILCALPFKVFEKRKFITALFFIPIISFVGYYSLKTYFIDQRFDFSSWSSFSTPETYIGHLAKREEGKSDIYVPDAWNGGPAITLLTGKPQTFYSFVQTRDLPLIDRGKDAIVVLPEQDQSSFTSLKEYYPSAVVEELRGPTEDGSPGNILINSVRVPREIIKSSNRWNISENSDGSISVLGNLRLPLEQQVSFSLSSALNGILAINHEIVPFGKPFLLARGSNRLELKLCSTSAEKAEQVLLMNKLQIPNDYKYSIDTFQGGLTGYYIQGLNRDATPAVIQIDPTIAFYFHLLPLNRPFSIIWKGFITFDQPGEYKIGVSSIDATEVLISNQIIVKSIEAPKYNYETVNFTPGIYPIEVRYFNKSDYAQIYLKWITPAGMDEVIPAKNLFPLTPSGKALNDIPREDSLRCGSQYHMKIKIAAAKYLSTHQMTH